MPTNLPGSLDTPTQLPVTRSDATVAATNHAGDHNTVNGAVLFLEKTALNAFTQVPTRILPTAYMDNDVAGHGNDDQTWISGWARMIGSGCEAVPAVIFSTPNTHVVGPVIQRYLDWRNQFRAAGILCLGYIDANNSGANTWITTQAAVQTEIGLYESLGYKVDGIWFDNSGQDISNVTGAGGRLRIYKEYMIANMPRQQKPLMVCNTGYYPSSSYGSEVDSTGGPLVDIINLERTYSDWINVVAPLTLPPAWALALPKTRFSCILTNSTAVADVDVAFGHGSNGADQRHVGYMYVDTGQFPNSLGQSPNTFHRLPYHWNRQVMYAGGRQQRFTYTARFPSPTTGQTQVGSLITEPMTLTSFSAYRGGGTSAPIQASRRRAGVTEDFLSTTLPTSTNAWVTATDPNGTPFYEHQDLMPGDWIIFTLGTVAGSPTEIVIQVEGTNP